ncbi:uncharacterized protein si:dkey-21c1.4 [Tachysurus fulvidraco]|uniref:uncharacterized protein si:dkey-21c1.4 n=1 Tax=Tachysurus fulvidraco TaxID=1234273 RepID=UPI001FEE4442|nr:uncharacterized protein si:dkey-21c1.4 [Tachysurus fulvidraco]
MSLEICPFCGKSFKRLKSHLSYCNMSPGSKTSKVTHKSKEIPTTTFKPKMKTTKVNTKNNDINLNCSTIKANSKSTKSRSKNAEKVNKELLQNISALTSTASKILSTEGTNTDTSKPKTKWLAKREQEMLKQAKLKTQTRIKFTSVSQQEKYSGKIFKTPVKDTHLSAKEIVSGQNQLTGTNLTSQLTINDINCSVSDPLQRVPWTTGCQDKQSIPADQTQISPKSNQSLTKEYKEQGVSTFQTKTCVWDHIKHGLYRRRYDIVPMLFPIVSAHKVSFAKCVNTLESVLKPHTGNDQNTTMKTSPGEFPILQTSVQRPVEDMLGSRLQNTSILPYAPEMETGYGGTFFCSPDSEISSNENVLMKCQTSKLSSQRQGLMTELRLGDVRLNELTSWLGAQTPKSTREAVTMFNKGWQWYYRKYIDVQKGGIGGIAMLIGSYCILGYIWSYPHIKKDRWRKYH